MTVRSLNNQLQIYHDSVVRDKNLLHLKRFQMQSEQLLYE